MKKQMNMNWKTPHLYQPERVSNVAEDILCICGLPKDSGLHIQTPKEPLPPLDTRFEEVREKIITIVNNANRMTDLEWERTYGVATYDFLIMNILHVALTKQRREILDLLKKYKCGEHKKLRLKLEKEGK
jgi:hypothetical protein